MKSVSFGILVLLFVILAIDCQPNTTVKQILSAKNSGFRRCQKPKNGQHLCFCGKNRVVFDRLTGERCINGKVVQQGNQKRFLSNNSDIQN